MIFIRLSLSVDYHCDELASALAGDHSVRRSGVVVYRVALADDLDMVVALNLQLSSQDVVEFLTLVLTHARSGRSVRLLRTARRPCS